MAHDLAHDVADDAAHDVLSFYARPGRFTGLDQADRLPDAGIEAVVAAVQGLVVYDLAAQPFYGVELDPIQAEAIHERDSRRLVDTLRTIKPGALDEAREPAARIGGRCHSYTKLTVALLRAAGVPARSRCGFGGYFVPGWFEDHWVAEYWDAVGGEWRLVDAQLDEVWCDQFGFEGDPLAISPEQFLTAGHAWQGWRRVDLDDGRFGLTSVGEHGAHWIANNLRLDLAALNKVEMLPWDVWGVDWLPGEVPDDDVLEAFDVVAAFTVDPDADLAGLRACYENGAQLRVPERVFNVLRDRDEAVPAGSGSR
ncbi:MAG: transglutaminase-like domain-containing protein [Acidimicrobiales bacterium]